MKTEENNSIRNEEEYRRVILRFLEIYDAVTGTPEGEEAAYLAHLMKEYEDRNVGEMRCGKAMKN